MSKRTEAQKARRKELDAAKRLADPVAFKAARYSGRTKEQMRAIWRKQYASNPDSAYARVSAWRQRNSDTVRKWRKNSYWRDPEKARAEKTAYYWKNRDRMLAYWKAKHAADPLPMRAKVKEWAIKNPEKVRLMRCEAEGRRRARKAKVTVDLKGVRQIYSAIYDALYIECYWCEKPMERDDRTIDHLIPLSRGGPHAALNLAPCCSACNKRKHNKTPDEYREYLKLVSGRE